MIMSGQYKATMFDGTMKLFVEPAQGSGPRYFIVAFNSMAIRIPISAEITDERVIPIMMQRLEARVMDLLDHLTAPPKHGATQCPNQSL